MAESHEHEDRDYEEFMAPAEWQPDGERGWTRTMWRDGTEFCLLRTNGGYQPILRNPNWEESPPCPNSLPEKEAKECAWKTYMEVCARRLVSAEKDAPPAKMDMDVG
jgi:hypothetical protein